MRKAFSIFLFLYLLSLPSSYGLAAPTEREPKVKSETAILIDAETGQILFEKEAGKRMYPASLTKILTGIIALEEENLSKVVTVSENATNVDGTSVYLVEGEEIKWKRLIEGLLINSGNDAGVVIAEHLAGSEAAFAEEMNEFAEKKIGVRSSHFTNPHGLFDENNYTTAYDMAKIAQYAMENNTFQTIASTRELEWKGEGWDTTLHNHHKLLREYDGATGIKNGFVQQSGFTLATSAERENRELIVVTLNASTSQEAYEDATQLLDFGFEAFTNEKIEKDDTFTDEKGNQYATASDYCVTVPTDGNITKDIIGHSLLVKDGEGNLLLEAKVTPMEEEIKSEAASTNEGKEKQRIHWVEKVLYALLDGAIETTKKQTDLILRT
ncbi:D-alanyl-D-alanine carboxypeptidase family protein [Alteribacillus iranensis]|uniref:D-alanyl-D-alanine carboxypeptidase/D-alanyl-D-alanine carboxypeptidase (Penicillin-binding protein 5/6) n=1 Tax=Alteribacillus iranensis TaxID=930128 RepID=A0A1I2D3J8_9BACI|nr:D-alanyl-D-alanine carboxypeptidase family protein [Alteribacillus iranensis]SFE75092.1 D-alanyl-D-alanine carboxypeptidase/D-alanyl-D-alanine carboxypeptidase (penicillin-binding protein 5/6) [Alteribacillus iranensis]